MITWIFSFLVIFGVSINWGLSVELVIKVTSPKLRSTAKAFFHLISHSLGDAPSPLIIGSIADYYMSKEPVGKSFGDKKIMTVVDFVTTLSYENCAVTKITISIFIAIS